MRRQAIIWTNDDYFADSYKSLGLNELNFTFKELNPCHAETGIISDK